MKKIFLLLFFVLFSFSVNAVVYYNQATDFGDIDNGNYFPTTPNFIPSRPNWDNVNSETIGNVVTTSNYNVEATYNKTGGINMYNGKYLNISFDLNLNSERFIFLGVLNKTRNGFNFVRYDYDGNVIFLGLGIENCNVDTCYSIYHNTSFSGDENNIRYNLIFNSTHISIKRNYVNVTGFIPLNKRLDNITAFTFGSQLYDTGSGSNNFSNLIIKDATLFNTSETSLNLDVLLYNITNQEYTTNFLKENSLFYTYADVTYSGLFPFTDTCTFTAYNISANFYKQNQANFTFNNSNNIIQFNVNEGFTDLINDKISFSVCRVTGLTSLQVYVNGSIHKTISGSIIPLCSLGVHNEINITKQYNNYRDLNISLKCSGCDNTHKLKIVKDKNNFLVNYLRNFIKHTETMLYNATSELHYYKEHPYSYSNSFFTNISLNCNNTKYNETFIIGDILPIINIISIDGRKYFDGINIDSNGTNKILIDVFGDIITQITFNVSFSNGTLLKSVNTEFMNLSYNELDTLGLYNISITAIDNDGNSSNKKGYFILNDTTSPKLKFISPSNSNQSNFNNYIFLHINATDNLDVAYIWVNFTHYLTGFLYYDTFINATGQQLVYEYKDLINTTEFENGRYIANGKVCDSHTKNIIKDAKNIYYDNNFITFAFKDELITIESFGGCENSVSYERTLSKYKPIFNYDCDIPVKKYKIYSNKNLIYQENSKYKGHFIFGEHWIDFEQNGKVTVNYECETKKNFSVCYNVVTVHNEERNLKFESIGELNCYETSVLFYVNNAERTIVDSLDFTNIIIFYSLFIAIQLFFIYIAIRFDKTGIMFLACLMGVLISISFLRFVDLNKLFQNSILIYIFINIMLMIGLIFRGE